MDKKSKSIETLYFLNNSTTFSGVIHSFYIKAPSILLAPKSYMEPINKPCQPFLNKLIVLS